MAYLMNFPQRAPLELPFDPATVEAGYIADYPDTDADAITWDHAAATLRLRGLHLVDDSGWGLVVAHIPLEIADRVEAGEGDDYDIGTIDDIDRDMAFVRWESGVSTWTPLGDLRRA